MKSERLMTPYGRIVFNKDLGIPNQKFSSPQNYKFGGTLAIPITENVEFFKTFFAEYEKLKLSLGISFSDDKPFFKEEDKGELEGWMILKLTNSSRQMQSPIVFIDQKSLPCMPNMFYRGCWARAQIEMSTYSKQKTGISCKLLTLQFIKHDQELSYGTPGDVLPPIELSPEEKVAAQFQ